MVLVPPKKSVQWFFINHYLRLQIKVCQKYIFVLQWQGRGRGIEECSAFLISLHSTTPSTQICCAHKLVLVIGICICICICICCAQKYETKTILFKVELLLDGSPIKANSNTIQIHYKFKYKYKYEYNRNSNPNRIQMQGR